MMADFPDRVSALFGAQFPRLYRYLDRLSGEPELAADLAQEAFVRLHERGALPDEPEAWLVTVATNLLRNARGTGARRRRLLTPARATESMADPPRGPDEQAEAAAERMRVRAALETLPDRDRRILLLRAEGFSYREIGTAVGVNEHSVGTLYARARRAFRAAYAPRHEEAIDAPR